MTELGTFCVIFFGIIIIALIGAYLVVHGPKVVVHTHLHRYKTSTDYERLWELVVEKRLLVCRVNYSETLFYRYDTIARGTVSNDSIFGLGEDFNLETQNKEQFIALCQYKQIQFLDFADWDGKE